MAAAFNLDLTARLTGDKQVVAALQQLSSTVVPKAIEAGVRYAARSGKVVMAQGLRNAGTPIPSARIKEDLYVDVDGAKATIWASSQPVSAQRFRPRQVRKGLVLTFYRGERTLIPQGFLQANRAQRHRGKLGFMPSRTRPYGYDRSRKKPRKGMKFIHGLSVASIYLGGKHHETIQQAVQQRIEERLVTGITRALASSARGYGPKA
jgi:hypothetical protein